MLNYFYESLVHQSNYFFVDPPYLGSMTSHCGFPYMVKSGITQKSSLIGT